MTRGFGPIDPATSAVLPCRRTDEGVLAYRRNHHELRASFHCGAPRPDSAAGSARCHERQQTWLTIRKVTEADADGATDGLPPSVDHRAN